MSFKEKDFHFDRVVERAQEARQQKLCRLRERRLPWDEADLPVEPPSTNELMAQHYEPTEEEVAALAAAIRSGWPPEVLRQRAGALSCPDLEIAEIPAVALSPRSLDYLTNQ